MAEGAWGGLSDLNSAVLRVEGAAVLKGPCQAVKKEPSAARNMIITSVNAAKLNKCYARDFFCIETLVSFERKHFVTSRADLFTTSVRDPKSFFLYLKVPVSVETFVRLPARRAQGRGRRSGRSDRGRRVTVAGFHTGADEQREGLGRKRLDQRSAA